MNHAAYLHRSSIFCALTLWVCSACAPDDDGNNNLGPSFPPAGDSGLTTLDAAPVLGADTGVVLPLPDSGTPTFDSGPGPVTGGDSGPVVGGDSGLVTGGDAGPAPDTGTPRADLGQGDGKDVITIGDSWMSFSASEGIQNSLEEASMRDYRNFGVSGTKLLTESFAGPPITDQYEAAKMADPDIKTVIMTGGGNDILQEILFDCVDAAFDTSSVCKDQIDKVATRLSTFWAEMAADGVQDVVIIGYSRKVNPVLVGTVAKSVEYSASKIDPLCAAARAPLRCHTLDSDRVAPNLMFVDSIHPDGPGFDAIGAAVWELMNAKGMRR
jgi:lysophospholipase L1-like esterase